MSDYLLMVLEDEAAHATESPKAVAELIDRRAKFADGLRRTGAFRDGGRLRPSKEGTRVHRARGELTVRSGPFGGEPRALAGWYWVDAPNTSEAARIAEACPVLAADEVQVRPIMKGRLVGDKDARPGKVVACAVLGSAPTEEAWVHVMERIDRANHSFPSGVFLGGVRLEPPTKGARVAARSDAPSERRAMFDGPFLESKEVIGGLCFVRVTNMEEAARWAATTDFVVHGTLELRELWRT